MLTLLLHVDMGTYCGSVTCYDHFLRVSSVNKTEFRRRYGF